MEYAGKTYHTVKIGSQYWLKENLDVGVMIQGSDTARNNGTIEKYCYDNDTANCRVYGGLYQWDEAMQYLTSPGARGICPAGWHIPTFKQFETLDTIVGGDGNSLKDTTQGLESGKGTNTSGFSALLAGYRNVDDGAFHGLSYSIVMWSSTGSALSDALTLNLLYIGSGFMFGSYDQGYGHSIRCLKD